MTDWGIYKGSGTPPHEGIDTLPAPPAWRSFENRTTTRGTTFQTSREEVEMVNAALFLRRPLLITGKPGVGKSSLAYAVAQELQLGDVLRWPITTRSTLKEGLYDYDAIGRLQEANLIKLKKKESDDIELPDIGRYVRLGPLGTALIPTQTKRPRVLLVDEIDKSDIDLPNDLLHVFEEGDFVIPELARLPDDFADVDVLSWDNQKVSVHRGHVQCTTFPLVIFTSNGEREFPPAFLRRCLRLTIQPPDRDKLEQIVESHLKQQLTPPMRDNVDALITEFLKRRDKKELATDQLLNALYFVTQQVDPMSHQSLCDALLKSLSD